MSAFQNIKEACCEANKRLAAIGLVDLTFGNVSVLDTDQGVFAIKPSGVDYDALAPDDMVVVDWDGKTVEGCLRPSSDAPTHRRLYHAFAPSGVRSVIHTHSRMAVAFAQAGCDIPCLGTTHADYFRGPVPVTRPMTASEAQSDYEWSTGDVIAERFADLDPTDMPSVLVRHHGPFAWGATPARAIENARALEIVADMAWRSLAIQPTARELPPWLLDKHFSRKHGAYAYYGQTKTARNDSKRA